ncbi:multidrug efflux SMR transporter [Ktedonosporobacter rubrisoli]|uniref:Multidrug efflux SMR transporter n=1 Tax=Ktedonosporobacter rubrisoli TaxID=2509675 RepID=A0A4V0YZV8_KTERU|nr:multidrug efflux SMR transporter [Ktedonosporobacter rubrisoli]
MCTLYLLAAILSEVAGTIALKLSDGFTRLVPAIIVVVSEVLACVLLSLALKRIDVGFAYAIWSGLGTAMIAMIGIFWFKEPLTVIKLSAIGLIILGIAGLNLR